MLDNIDTGKLKIQSAQNTGIRNISLPQIKFGAALLPKIMTGQKPTRYKYYPRPQTTKQ